MDLPIIIEERNTLMVCPRDSYPQLKDRGITDGKVLDVGTGTGLLSIEFAKEIPDVEVIGLDLSDEH